MSHPSMAKAALALTGNARMNKLQEARATREAARRIRKHPDRCPVRIMAEVPLYLGYYERMKISPHRCKGGANACPEVLTREGLGLPPLSRSSPSGPEFSAVALPGRAIILPSAEGVEGGER